MSSKYPGGYRILDLGDLSLITNNPADTVVIPGIYASFISSDKPVILTGVNATTESGVDASQLLFCHWELIDGEWSFVYHQYDELGTLEYIMGISIHSDDKVVDVSLEMA